jgi:hypothetical protein
MAAGKRSVISGVPGALASRSDFLDSNGPSGNRTIVFKSDYFNSIAEIGLHVEN